MLAQSIHEVQKSPLARHLAEKADGLTSDLFDMVQCGICDFVSGAWTTFGLSRRMSYSLEASAEAYKTNERVDAWRP
jgi:hypothetical protein